MARFIDFHEDLKLPAEAIAQIAETARNATADRFGVRQIELYYHPDGKVYCLLEGPDEDAIRKHHAALGVPCGDVHQVDSLSRPPLHRDHPGGNRGAEDRPTGHRASGRQAWRLPGQNTTPR
jgi:Nickel responsive protein SCO4226-like